MATKIRPINLHTTVDTHVQGLIDSSYIQARQTAGTDSSSTQAMIDSNFSNMTNIDFPDGDSSLSGAKLTFGNDSDLQLYHNGSHSYISDQGTGQLRILSNTAKIRNADDDKDYAIFQNGAVKLYEQGNLKLETVDSGASITGNIAANIRSNPKGFSVTHTVDSSDNALLVGPINVDSGVTLTINGTLMVV